MSEFIALRLRFRLINGANTDLGQITKEKLQTMIKTVKAKTKQHLWRDSEAVIRWFEKLEDTKDLSFFQFDIEKYSIILLSENARFWIFAGL